MIAAISIAAFLWLPVTILSGQDIDITLKHIRLVLEIPEAATRSQTYAFTVLAMSQIFHAIGMRDTGISFFKMKHFSNKLMLAAIGCGFLLQLAVTEIPYLINAFGTCPLSMGEWLRLILLSAAPLLLHELLLLFRFK